MVARGAGGRGVLYYAAKEVRVVGSVVKKRRKKIRKHKYQKIRDKMRHKKKKR